MTSSLDQYIHSIPRDSQGFILSEQERAKVLEAFHQGKSMVKLSKKNNDIQYSVIQDDQQNLYAIYTTGGKWKDERGFAKGAQGILKVAQNCATGKFCLVKITKGQLGEKPYIQHEAENESSYLIKRQMAFGKQTRQTQKYDYKHYTFMQIMPGILLGRMGPNSKGTFREKAKDLKPIEQARFLLNMLEQFQIMYQQGVIHRDLHLENVLVDPASLAVNIIDFGLMVHADENGYCWTHSVVDTNKRRPEFRHANGMDLEGFFQFSDDYFSDETLLALAQDLIKAAGNYEKYNSVDLAPYIEQVKAYIEFLSPKDKSSNKP